MEAMAQRVGYELGDERRLPEGDAPLQFAGQTLGIGQVLHAPGGAGIECAGQRQVAPGEEQVAQRAAHGYVGVQRAREEHSPGIGVVLGKESDEVAHGNAGLQLGLDGSLGRLGEDVAPRLQLGRNFGEGGLQEEVVQDDAGRVHRKEALRVGDGQSRTLDKGKLPDGYPYGTAPVVERVDGNLDAVERQVARVETLLWNLRRQGIEGAVPVQSQLCYPHGPRGRGHRVGRLFGGGDGFAGLAAARVVAVVAPVDDCLGHIDLLAIEVDVSLPQGRRLDRGVELLDGGLHLHGVVYL